LSGENKAAFVKRLREDYEKSRAQHASQRVKLLSLEAARANAAKLKSDSLPKPEFNGIASTDPSLDLLVPLIDWTPFFHTWELRGVYPKILQHEKYGEQARTVFAEANVLLDEIVAKKLLRARAVYGLFPANAVGDDVELYTDASRSEVLSRFRFLRQQTEKKEKREPNRSLADFIAPKSTGLHDHIGAFAVSTGFGLK